MISKSQSFPWKHFLLEEFFKPDDFDFLKTFKIENTDYSNITGFRDVISGRCFINNELVNKNKQLKGIINTLNDKQFFSNLFGRDITNTYIRAELIHDQYPFFHDVHTDLSCKNLTIIINIDKEDEKNLSTDLYYNKTKHIKKLDWIENGGIAFPITDKAWHGFDKIQYKGLRKIMIINYVNPDEWRDKEQCYV